MSIFKPILVAILTLGAELAYADIISSEETLNRADLEKFLTAKAEIKKYYIEPVDDHKLYEAAIRGMMASLEPHSDYLSPQDLNSLKETTRGEYVGIGVELAQEDNKIVVKGILDGSPAQKASLKPGDVLLRVNDTPLIHMNLQDVVKSLQGKPGSKVKLLVYRASAPKKSNLLNPTLTREKIQIKSVDSKLVEPGYGVIRISYFQQGTEHELKEAYNKLLKESNGNLKGLVLDLRSNPGGLLDSAILVAENLINNANTIVTVKDRDEQENLKLKPLSHDITNGVPLAVLINGGTASGAEIVAAALQDYKRAVVVGTRSFGKGSVQTVIPLNENSAIKISTALFYSPKGHAIQAVGIKPDIEVKELAVQTASNNINEDLLNINEASLSRHLTPEGVNKSSASPSSNVVANTNDYQLLSAINVLKGLQVHHS